MTDEKTENLASAEGAAAAEKKKSPLQEIVQPFIDLVHAPRALWGVNLGYTLEGLAYFGILGYLALHFSDFVFQGVPSPDTHAHTMVMVLTAGITISMLFLGFVADKTGVRFALITAFVLMIIGRSLIAGAPTVLHLQPAGLWSPLHLLTMAGILLVVVGYGMYQPAAYAAVRKFTTPKTAGMAFAMLYALMNLGGWFPTFAFLLRDKNFLGLGIPGTFWVYVGVTVLALLSTLFLLTRRTVARAIASAKEETARLKAVPAKKPAAEAAAQAAAGPGTVAAAARRLPPVQMWILIALLLVAIYVKTPPPGNLLAVAIVAAAWLIAAFLPVSRRFLVRHPLADAKFFFFIFALIPVQTLFTYNWLVLPEYISRAYAGWVGRYFEIASNANPILIFVFTPVIAALTQKRKVYDMMVAGTFVMGAPAFLLILGPHPWTLGGYILLMTVGEAMWSPRFLQYAAEIAPEGRTGEYMGVAQLPWFLTKVLVPWLYSGRMMDRFCPANMPREQLHTGSMWLIFAIIAMGSTVLLLVAKRWVGKDFKTQAAA